MGISELLKINYKLQLHYLAMLTKSVFRISILFLFTLVIVSCNYLIEPESLFNKNMNLPENKSYTLTNYQPGQVLAGIINLPFTPDLNVLEIDHVSLFIDSAFTASKIDSPYIFSIDTKKWQKGSHSLSFCVYKKEKSLGLLDLINSPSQIYSVSLVFDNTFPTAPTNIVIKNKDNHPYISWTPTQLSNFYSYIVLRDGKVIDTLYYQSDSVFVDTSYTLSDYFKITYHIGASTLATVAYSQPETLAKGESLMIGTVSTTVDGLKDKVFFQSSKLISISTQTGNVLAQNNTNHCVVMVPNLIETTLYYLDGTDINFFDINTLELKSSEPFSLNPGGFFDACAGRDSSLFFSVPERRLIIYYHGGIGNLDRTFVTPTYFISVSPEENFIFGGDRKDVFKYSMRIDTEMGPFVQLVDQSFETDSVDLFKVDWNNLRLFVKRQKHIIEIWNTETLSPIKSFILEGEHPEVSGITSAFANSEDIYVAYSTKLNNKDATFLAKYNIATGQQSRTWTLSYKIKSILGAESGKYIFACSSSDQWIIDTGGTP